MHYGKEAKKLGAALCATLLLAPMAFAKEKKAAPAKDPTKSFIEQSVKDYRTCLEVNLNAREGYLPPDKKTFLLEECGARVGLAYVVRTSLGFLACAQEVLPIVGTGDSEEDNISLILKDGREYKFSFTPSEEGNKEGKKLTKEDEVVKKKVESCAKKQGAQVFDFERVKEYPTPDGSSIKKRVSNAGKGSELSI